MKRLLKILSVIGLVVNLISCSNNEDKAAEQDATPLKFVVGTSADNPPYEYIDEGQVVGFDMDLAKLIADELKQELIIKNLDFSGLLPAILSQNVDLVAAALTVNDERSVHVDFSIPYTSTKMAILYNTDQEVQSLEDFAGKTIGVQFGTTWEDFAKKFVSSHQATQLKSLANNLTLVQELNNGNIDAVILEDIQVVKFSANYPNLKILLLNDTAAEFALALPKNSPLTPKINEIIKKLLENGTIDKLKAKWLK